MNVQAGKGNPLLLFGGSLECGACWSDSTLII
jgi:hypothetical protein